MFDVLPGFIQWLQASNRQTNRFRVKRKQVHILLPNHTNLSLYNEFLQRHLQ